MNLLLAVMFLCVVPSAFGAFEKTSQGSTSTGMGGASVALAENPWGAYSNPGVLPTLSKRVVSFFYVPQPFGLKELARGSFSYVEATTLGTLGITGSRFGFELYREVVLGISYARTLDDRFSAGVTLNYFSLTIQNYGSNKTFGVDAGFLVRVSENVQWGFAAFNLNAPTIGSTKEKLPQVYATGLQYSPISEASLSVDIVKDIRYPTELHMGIEYTILGAVDIRGGTASEPSLYTAGAGIHYMFFHFDYAFSVHQDLGATHSFSLSLFLE